jgi:hypothetical protein
MACPSVNILSSSPLLVLLASVDDDGDGEEDEVDDIDSFNSGLVELD